MILVYGPPYEYMVIDKVTTGPAKIIDGQELRESFITLKEGSIDETPMSIKWNKGSYKTEVFVKRLTNQTEITFALN